MITTPKCVSAATGDNAGAAAAVAAAVGLATSDVHAELLPEQKLQLVRSWLDLELRG